MKNEKYIAEEIDQTFRSLNGIERATPKPFFVSRLETRLERHSSETQLQTWRFRPVYVAASLGLVFLLNVSALLLYQNQLSTEDQQAVENLAAEWTMESIKLDP